MPSERPEGENASGAVSDVSVTRIGDYWLGPARPVLWVMLGGAVLMVLLTCSSVAGLQLFRAARNDRALAQLALGASRRRLVGRALIEAFVLTIIGSVGAVGVAWIATTLLVSMAPIDVPPVAQGRV